MKFYLTTLFYGIIFSGQIHRNFEEIYELLSSNKIGGVLIDGYMVGSKKHLFEKPFLRIYRVYDYSAVYGVATGGDSRKLGKCFHNYIQKNIARIFQHVAENVEAIQVTSVYYSTFLSWTAKLFIFLRERVVVY